MGYAFEAGESLPSAVRRVAAEQLGSAVAGLRDEAGDRAEAVHAARKHIKKTRALIRLAVSDRSVARHEHAELRAAAHELAGARDAAVLLATFDALATRHEAALRPAAVRRLRRHFEPDKQMPEPDIAAATTRLDAVCWRTDDWPLADDPAEGLLRAWKRGRSAFRDAAAGGEDEQFHRWRRRVKDVWYHLRLLQPADPEGIGSLRQQADDLAEVLGQEHDLTVLLNRIDDADPVAVAVAALAHADRDALRRQALAVGTTLFAKRPRDRAKTLTAAWRRHSA